MTVAWLSAVIKEHVQHKARGETWAFQLNKHHEVEHRIYGHSNSKGSPGISPMPLKLRR